jgi:hypothetical protein
MTPISPFASAERFKVVTDVASHHIRDVLDQAREQGKSRRTLTHVRRVMNLIFGLLWGDEVLPVI